MSSTSAVLARPHLSLRFIAKSCSQGGVGTVVARWGCAMEARLSSPMPACSARWQWQLLQALHASWVSLVRPIGTTSARMTPSARRSSLAALPTPSQQNTREKARSEAPTRGQDVPLGPSLPSQASVDMAGATADSPASEAAGVGERRGVEGPRGGGERHVVAATARAQLSRPRRAARRRGG